MAFTIKDAGAYVNSLFGNTGPAVATGAGVAVQKNILALRQQAIDKVQAAGRLLGPILGTALPGALAEGAQETAPSFMETLASYEKLVLGNSYGGWAIIGASLGIGVLIWMLIRSR